MSGDNEQVKRFKEAAQEADAPMTKEEFARVIGGLAKPQAPTKEADEDQAADE